MNEAHSDALVIFGVTGDLAHKAIFPALYALVKSGALHVAGRRRRLAEMERWSSCAAAWRTASSNRRRDRRPGAPCAVSTR